MHTCYPMVSLPVPMREKEDACSMIRHVPLGSVNLLKISKLNQLARDICDKKCTISEAWGSYGCHYTSQEGSTLDSCPMYRYFGSGGFAILFGANFWMDPLHLALVFYYNS